MNFIISYFSSEINLISVFWLNKRAMTRLFFMISDWIKMYFVLSLEQYPEIHLTSQRYSTDKKFSVTSKNYSLLAGLSFANYMHCVFSEESNFCDLGIALVFQGKICASYSPAKATTRLTASQQTMKRGYLLTCYSQP